MERFEKYMWILALASVLTYKFNVLGCVLIAEGIRYIEDVYRQ